MAREFLPEFGKKEGHLSAAFRTTVMLQPAARALQLYGLHRAKAGRQQARHAQLPVIGGFATRRLL